MGLSWTAIFQYAISGAFVSWPAVLFGYWLSHRKTTEHVDAVTKAQTAKFEKITDEQTSDLRDITEAQTAQLTGNSSV